ncbi:MAG TPA: UDP-N-acetylmuramate dehydrogenase [Candidatus Hypogeohydataceae bacterium YC38]|nr:UDP-N-acetylmuramate dehydrogenase [Candidatus Brocadiales bacterium]
MVEALSRIIRYKQPLRSYTSFGVGGPAEVFAEPITRAELQGVLDFGKGQDLDIFTLGRGSNILVGDKGVSGLVVHLPDKSFNRVERRGSEMVVEAGVSLPLLIQKAADQGLGGLEVLVGIPGSLGGAVAMNAGGRYGTIEPLVKGVTTIGYDGEFHYYKRGDVSFGYRSSSLSDEIILEVELELSKDDKADIRKRMEGIHQEKNRTQPLSSRSAGCVFKNPEGCSAGALIDRSGLKGTQVGGAAVSTKHANFIINRGSATAAHILELIHNIREEVKKRFGVLLELEIKIW